MGKEKKKGCKSFIRLVLIGFSIVLLIILINISLLSSFTFEATRTISKQVGVLSAASVTDDCTNFNGVNMCYCGGRDDSKRVGDGFCDLACISTFNDCSPSFCKCNCKTPTQCSCTSPIQCDDKKKCTTDDCSSSKICTHVPIPGCVDPCDTLNCDDANACTTDTCELGSCKHVLITCPIPGQICSNQKCIPCTPNCDGKCGPDGCGGTCPTCPSGYDCNGGKCVCIPKTCEELGKSCGDIADGCGKNIPCGKCDNQNGGCLYGSCNIYSGKCDPIPARKGTLCDLGPVTLSSWQSAWNSLLKNFGITGFATKENQGECDGQGNCGKKDECKGKADGSSCGGLIQLRNSKVHDHTCVKGVCTQCTNTESGAPLPAGMEGDCITCIYNPSIGKAVWYAVPKEDKKSCKSSVVFPINDGVCVSGFCKKTESSCNAPCGAGCCNSAEGEFCCDSSHGGGPQGSEVCCRDGLETCNKMGKGVGSYCSPIKDKQVCIDGRVPCAPDGSVWNCCRLPGQTTCLTGGGDFGGMVPIMGYCGKDKCDPITEEPCGDFGNQKGVYCCAKGFCDNGNKDYPGCRKLVCKDKVESPCSGTDSFSKKTFSICCFVGNDPNNPIESCSQNPRGTPKCIWNTDKHVGKKSSTNTLSIYITRDKNNFTLDGIGYVITPHITFNKNVTITMQSYDENQFETYKYSDHESVLGICNNINLGSITKEISSDGGVINYADEINLDIPALALNNEINFTIAKYNLSNCYSSNDMNPFFDLNNSSPNCDNVTCTPSNDCKLSNCNSATGGCDETNKPDNSSCDIEFSSSNIGYSQGICKTGQCFQNCSNNFDCSDGYLCKKSVCVVAPSNAICNNDSYCKDMMNSCFATCLNGRCTKNVSMAITLAYTSSFGITGKAVAETSCIPPCEIVWDGNCACPVNPPPAMCQDSDKDSSTNPNYYKKGVCYDSNTGSHTDTCASSGRLQEFDCNDKKICEASFVNCPYGGVCKNGSCIYGKCTNDSECGISGFTDQLFCKGNAVFDKYAVYSCSNPGTNQASCLESDGEMLRTICNLNQVCSDGKCIGIAPCVGSKWKRYPECKWDDSECDCNPDCTGKKCGDNGCGGSCGTCSFGYICSSDGQCITSPNVKCNKNSDCGKDEFIDNLTCAQGSENVYQKYFNYTCNNAGTLYNYCSNLTYFKLIQVCGPGQFCNNGKCGTICDIGSVCRSSADICDIPEYYDNNCKCPDDLFKSSANICRSSINDCDLDEYCSGSSSLCSDDSKKSDGTLCSLSSVASLSPFLSFLKLFGVTLSQVNGICQNGVCVGKDCTPQCSGKQCGIDPVCGISCGTCPSGQICNANQQCITNPTPGVKCNKNSDCGTDSWIGSLFCQNGNIFQNYITYTCNNPGADSSYCSNSASPKLNKACVSGQRCSNGQCINIKITTIGLYNPSNSNFYLRNSNTQGVADITFAYGAPNNGWTPIAGDWNGDGKTTIGFYETNPTTSKFYLRNSNTAGYADLTFSFGAANKALIPISGDWDSDGKTTIGLYDLTTSTFFLRNSNTQGNADITFAYGAAGTGLPIAGDWDGDGKTTIGLYNPLTSTFYLRNSNSAGYADITFAYGAGNSGWIPISGDWDGDGKTTIGLYNPTTSTFYLRNSNTAGYADITFAYGAGNSGWKPISGDWDGI